MGRLKIPFSPRLAAGGVLTFAGTAPGQAVYWSLLAIDPRPGYGPWPACGGLKFQRTRTDKSSLSTNVYVAPKRAPRIRVGMGYKVGQVKVGQESGLYDRVTVKCAE